LLDVNALLAFGLPFGIQLPMNQGKTLLAQLKRTNGLRFTFISDDQTIASLPAWVERTNQITDGHLAEMAKANDALLAMLDEKIPGSFVIPS